MYVEHSEGANVTSAGYNGINAIFKASLLFNVCALLRLIHNTHIETAFF